MIFVDTGAWFALFCPRDADHSAARRWLSTNVEALVTTDLIVAETLNLMRHRREPRAALVFGKRIYEGKLTAMHRITTTEFDDAWMLFRQFADKEWSFTDCSSRLIMNRLHISTAFAFDHHFHQFGTVAVVP